MKKTNLKKLFSITLILVMVIFSLCSCTITYKFNDSNDTNTDKVVSEKEENNTSYYFRNDNLLSQHYDKHGKDMGFDSKESYEAAASDVINNPNALHKTEKEDGDEVYYVEETNEFVVLSTDGYIRTYFLPDKGITYYNKQ